MKTIKQISIIVLLAIIALAVIGCKEDESTPPPPPHYDPPPPNEVNVGAFKVTINNYELLSAEKLNLLKKVTVDVLTGKTLTGNLTINVIIGSSSDFIPAGSKTLSVGANWVNGASESQMGGSLTASVTDWIAMMKSTKVYTPGCQAPIFASVL